MAQPNDTLGMLPCDSRDPSKRPVRPDNTWMATARSNRPRAAPVIAFFRREGQTLLARRPAWGSRRPTPLKHVNQRIGWMTAAATVYHSSIVPSGHYLGRLATAMIPRPGDGKRWSTRRAIGTRRLNNFNWTRPKVRRCRTLPFHHQPGTERRLKPEMCSNSKPVCCNSF